MFCREHRSEYNAPEKIVVMRGDAQRPAPFPKSAQVLSNQFLHRS